MKNLFTKFTLIFIVVFAMLSVGCGKKTARTMARASFEFSGLANDVVAGIDRAYDEKIFSFAMKDKLSDYAGKMIRGGKKGHAMLEGFLQTTSVLSQPQLAQLDKIFSEEVVGPFLEILQELKVLSPSQATYLHQAIAALRASILILSGYFASAGFPDHERRLLNAV